MARRFATNDTLTCSMGSAPTSRAGSTLLLVRAYDAAFDILATNTDFISGLAGTTAVSGTFVSGGNIFSANDFGSGLAGPSDKNQWYVIGATKTSGNTAYSYTMSPVGGSWTQATSGSSADGSGINSIVFGKGVIGGAKMDIAAAAQWATPKTIAQLQALGNTSMDAWLAGSPSAAWQFNQASIATALTDLTGGGANQTAISGTTVVADPAGWTYHSSTTPFTKDVVERYRVFAGLTKDVVETYRVLNALTKDVIERYRLTNSFNKDVVETYRVLNSLTKDVVERYRVTNGFSKDVLETYRVLNGLTKDIIERYRVFAGFTKDVVEVYNVLNGTSFTKDVVEQYRIYNPVTVDVVERYRVLNGLSKDVVERYSVFSGITKDVIERYRIFALITRDVVERYQVGTRQALPADAIAYLDGLAVIATLGPVSITARI
jgi:hypothetical protein